MGATNQSAPLAIRSDAPPTYPAADRLGIRDRPDVRRSSSRSRSGV